MIKTLLLGSCLSLALIACQAKDAAAPQLSYEVPSRFALEQNLGMDAGEIAIPFKKFTLDNGLTVVLHKDNSDPLVHVDVTYHVGSGREDAGKSGFAHFFEHMMFQGSENVADEQHFKIITESGGTLNGTTNSDRTNYYETVPSNQLEKMLWLEADRMGFFLNAVTEEKFENQRETVKNERGQNYDNRPYGLLYERIGEALFPEGHPYSWTVIGSLPDLQAATLDDLREFHTDWYGPNNVTLSIVGDIDIAETKKKVELWFGEIPRGRDVEKPAPQPVTLEATKNLWFEDNFAKLPELRLTYPTVEGYHADEQALDLLAGKIALRLEGRKVVMQKLD